MITITPLGVGGAFTERYYHNNYIFDLGERKLLVDAGTTIRYSLKESSYQLSDITDILITHLHADHVGGLEEIGQRCKFMLDHKPNLWVREDMKQELFEVIGKGLETGFTILDYFNVCIFDINKGFVILDCAIQTIKTDELHAKNMKSFGFQLIQPNGNNTIFTSDIADIESALFDIFIDDKTKAIFHDCSLVENPVHSSLEEIVNYYDYDVLDKFYMMHYQDNTDIDKFRNLYRVNFAIQGESYIFD